MIFKVAVNTETGKVVAVAGPQHEIKTPHMLISVRSRSEFMQRFGRDADAVRMMEEVEVSAASLIDLDGVVTLTDDEIRAVRDKVSRAKTVKDTKGAINFLVDSMD